MEYINLIEGAVQKITQQRNNAYGDSIGLASKVWESKLQSITGHSMQISPIDHCLMMIDLKSVRGMTAQHTDIDAFIDSLEDIIGYALLAYQYIDKEANNDN